MKISFLFGAGAEGKGQYNICSGAEFKMNTIRAENAGDFAHIFCPSFKMSNGPIIAWNSNSVLYQTVKENPELLDSLFTDINMKKIVEDYIFYKDNKKKMSKEESQKVTERFQEVYRRDFYDMVKSGNLKCKNIRVFLENAGVYSFYDSLFNYLRYPQKYGTEVARVAKLYYSSYLSIIKAIDDKFDINKFSNDDIYSGWNEYLVEIQKRCIERRNNKSSKTYYDIINSLVGYHDLSFSTTNYTQIAETVMNLSSDKIAYLHGRLDYFEDIYTKRIDVINNFSRTNQIIPYILVQSGVKPIISPYQIEEFHKFKEQCIMSDVFIILGYGLNLDDEHIINFVRERLTKKLKTIVFIFDGDNSYNLRLEATQKIFENSKYLTCLKSSSFCAYIEERRFEIQ